VPHKYSFLPDITAIVSEPPAFSPQVIVMLDVGSGDRVAVEKSLLGSVPAVINVDHHPGNSLLGTWRFVDESICATCAIIYRICRRLEVPIHRDAATQLFCGIMTDTGRLSFSNANAEAFSICADLVDKGAEPHRIAREVYFQEDSGLARMRGGVLSTLELSADGKVCSMVLSEDVARWGRGGSSDNFAVDTEGLVDYAVRIRGVEVGILVKWAGKDVVKVSFRSAGGADVNGLAKLFGGGGHRNAAGCTLAGDVAEVKSRVLAEAERWLSK
jgi:phosphoesterase RecJ-like protein